VARLKVPCRPFQGFREETGIFLATEDFAMAEAKTSQTAYCSFVRVLVAVVIEI